MKRRSFLAAAGALVAAFDLTPRFAVAAVQAKKIAPTPVSRRSHIVVSYERLSVCRLVQRRVQVFSIDSRSAAVSIVFAPSDPEPPLEEQVDRAYELLDAARGWPT